MISFICYITSLPKANTSTYNRLFVGFNFVIVLNAIGLGAACKEYKSEDEITESITRIYIVLECSTVGSFFLAAFIWVSVKKDGF